MVVEEEDVAEERDGTCRCCCCQPREEGTAERERGLVTGGCGEGKRVSLVDNERVWVCLREKRPREDGRLSGMTVGRLCVTGWFGFQREDEGSTLLGLKDGFLMEEKGGEEKKINHQGWGCPVAGFFGKGEDMVKFFRVSHFGLPPFLKFKIAPPSCVS